MHRKYDLEDALNNPKVIFQRKWVKVTLRGGIRYFQRLYQRLLESPKGNTHFGEERQYWHTEKKFLADRDSSKQNSFERLQACELVAVDNFSLKNILSATDPESNAKLYEQISMLETTYISQLITLDYIDGKPFQEQRGLARFSLIKFYLIKTLLCDKLDEKLNEENLNKFIVEDTEIRLTDIKNEISLLLKEAFAVSAHDSEALKEFTNAISSLTANASEIIELPTSAPEYYKQRSNKKEKPTDFIKRVYAQWLRKGLTRPHIKNLDLSLYQNLYRQGIPKEFDTLLPKAAGRSIESMSKTDSQILETNRASARKGMRRLRKQRSK